MKLPVSVIIPAFNEGEYIGKLLASLKAQTSEPKEVIVVDAFSTDNTVEVVKKYGYKVVQDKAWIAEARNIGAKLTKQPLMLFLDADVILPSDFLEKIVTEFQERKLDAASCYHIPLSAHKIDHVLYGVSNTYLQLMSYISTRAFGYCILVKREFHNRIEGFDNSLAMAEDHDYANRLSKLGDFGFIRSAKVPVSPRRFHEDGRVRLTAKIMAAEMHLLFIGNIKRPFFSYEFGQHTK